MPEEEEVELEEEKSELEEDMKKLKEELLHIKEELGEVKSRFERRGKGIYIDVGSRVRDYVKDVTEGVAEGIRGELEKSVFIGPDHFIKVRKNRHVKEEVKLDFANAAEAMSALGNEYRLKILGQLMHGGKYISDLQDKLPDIASSTLSSHLDILEEVGFVVQEKVRGRYLITIPGRAAYKMVKRTTRILRKELR